MFSLSSIKELESCSNRPLRTNAIKQSCSFSPRSWFEKLVTSTKSTKIINDLEEIYIVYGNPETQISDNGLLFSSKAIEHFTKLKLLVMREKL